MYDSGEQWLGSFVWKAIACTAKVYLFKGEKDETF